ncbi:MAG: hypothetical protein J7502_03720 [Flavisolibacter sp.]|nr:hypothetical protein [Flavisolibacter sp.]
MPDDDNSFESTMSSSNLFSMHHSADAHLGSLIKRKPLAVTATDSLKMAVAMMAKETLTFCL